MNKKKLAAPAILLSSALALAISSAAISVPAVAQDAKVEKCYGIASAGKNDCQTATSSCAGTSKFDRQPDAFLLVPAGTCSKIAGGTVK